MDGFHESSTGVQALNDCRFELRVGEVHALWRGMARRSASTWVINTVWPTSRSGGMGRTAVERLIARLGGDESPARETVLHTQIRIRRSCGCP